jgi:hypothetical protein
MKHNLILLFLAFGLVSCVASSGLNCTDKAEYCVKLNGKCTADFWGTNSTYCTTFSDLNGAKSNPVCCSITQYCVNSTCMDNNIGSPCKSNLDCRANLLGNSPVECNSNGFCQAIYGAGDTCSTDSDCYTGGPVSLKCGNTSKCTGRSVGEVCYNDTFGLGYFPPDLGISTCALPAFCARAALTDQFTCQAASNYVGKSGTCSLLADGSSAYPPCAPGYQCDGKSCIQIGTVASGSSCGNANLACSGTAFCYNGSCSSTKAQKPVSCSNSSDCTSIQANADCVCTTSGKGYCAFTGENVAAGIYNSEQEVNLVNCLVKNNCSLSIGYPQYLTQVNLNKQSCAVENCNSDIKKYQSASCDQVKAAGSCYNNPYCSGFPVWAIIVIVVVAVILVLSVVIVVFLVLRKRRDYSSI